MNDNIFDAHPSQTLSVCDIKICADTFPQEKNDKTFKGSADAHIYSGWCCIKKIVGSCS